MIWLVAASLLWAFSFGLIKGQLAGLDPATVAAGRLLLAAVAFLPFLASRRRGRPGRGVVLRAIGLGAVQFGLMYVLYIASFGWLAGWQVALLTVFTPFYVLLLKDPLRLPKLRALLAVAIAVAGAVWVQYDPSGSPASGKSAWPGVLLLQGANLCFAWGQLRFGGLVRRGGVGEAAILAWMYVGAFALAALAAAPHLPAALQGWSGRQGLVLLYLGLVPTALGFALWNRGAARAGTAFLAAANDLKIPLAVLVSWLVFGEQADSARVLPGLAAVVLALFLVREPVSGTAAGPDRKGAEESNGNRHG